MYDGFGGIRTRARVPEEYLEYIQFSARVINRTFPYVEETGSDEDTSWVVSGLKDVLALDITGPYDARFSPILYLYSEDFGLYDVPRRLNESISGITMSDLLLADSVDVSGYYFVVSSRRNLYRIFCILDLEVVFSEGSIGNDVARSPKSKFKLSERDFKSQYVGEFLITCFGAEKTF